MEPRPARVVGCNSRLGGSIVGTPDANASLLNNPQPSLDWFSCQHMECAREKPQHLLGIRLPGPEHDDARPLRGRIDANVSEIEIQGEEDPPFAPAHRDDSFIPCAGLPQQFGGVQRHVLVEFAAHQ